MAARATKSVSPSLLALRGRSESVSSHNEDPGETSNARITQSEENSPVPTPPAKYPPTSQDWENHRHIFTRLYSFENKTLDQVMEVMKNDYQFKATSVRTLSSNMTGC